MVLKLYGAPKATCTRRVAAVLYEKNIPFEFVNIDMSKGEHKSPEHFARHPFGRVPVLEDDGFILFESRAIMRYIDIKFADHAPKLIPTDLEKNALFEQAASLELNHFDPAAAQTAAPIFYKRAQGLEPDWETHNKNLPRLITELNGYEKMLSKYRYIGGDEVTIADISHLPWGAMLADVGVNLLEDEARYPNVARWWKEITNLKGWLAVKDGVKSLSA